MSLWRTSFSFPSTTPLLKSLIFLLPTLYPLRISAQAGIRISHCQVLPLLLVNQEMAQATISRLSMVLHCQYTGEVRLLFSFHPFSAKKNYRYRDSVARKRYQCQLLIATRRGRY